MYSFHRSCRVAGLIGSSGPRFGWECLRVLVVASVFAAEPVIGASPPRVMLAMVGRTVTQDQGAWVIDYRLRHTGQTGVIVMPEEIGVKVEGWVSNSRVPNHAVPRWASLVVAHGPDLSTVSEVIASVDEANRCRERLLVSIRTDDPGPSRRDPGDRDRGGTTSPSVSSAGESTAVLPLSLGPGAIVRVRVRLEHQHILYGDLDPLLAVRTVELTIGGTAVRDIVSLDREHYLAQPKFAWPEPPEERRDTAARCFRAGQPASGSPRAWPPVLPLSRAPRSLQHQDAATVLVPDRRRHRRRVWGAGDPVQRHTHLLANSRGAASNNA